MFRKKPSRINSYLGYGTATKLRATGRALEDKGIDFKGNTGTFRTLWNIYKQFKSDEIPNVKITLTLANGQSYTTITDAEGYYHFDEKYKETISSQTLQWHPYTVSFLNIQKRKIIRNNAFRGEMLIPSSKASYGIISDIDDTILHTGVASLFKWRVIINTFFKNFDKRLPLEGTVDFYKKLEVGKNQFGTNPIFYVSNSPWNLYDYLSAFLIKHNFPKGPILLRDFRTPFDRTPKPKIPHKYSEIINILNLYPKLNFILIGDSGEKDADIYINISQNYPGRILAIYLRNVQHKRKEKRIRALINKHATTPSFLVSTSKEAENHARKLGFIN
ncbi:hypothetical protein AB832_03950 [Flavobacteriaceae bacterium (ex Bugula neritina AB1)]|nr:hypothetical protein AB832_03950 [Flavobacteriaceae bacterium (ex Bugula neritina AB1)]